MKDKLTIVGPEPTENEGNILPKKVNIEALMLMAKYDEDFRKKLLEDRDRAIAESGIGFSRTELFLLKNLSSNQLEESIREFRVPGITRKSLPSWKKASAIIILLSAFIIPTLDCTSNVIIDDGASGKKTVEGWIDRDTFQVISLGVPSMKAQGKEKRRASARSAALIMAQQTMIEKFYGYSLQAGGIVHNPSKKDFHKEFAGVIKDGSIIKEIYDDDDNCEILYQIRSTGLKKRLDNFYSN
jgi:hypothetical protein